MASNPNTPSEMDARRVLYIPELFGQIISYLDPLSLLSLRTVSKAFNSAIITSRELSFTTGAGHVYRRNPSDVSQLSQTIFTPIGLHLFSLIWKEVTRDIIHAPRSQENTIDIDLLTRQIHRIYARFMPAVTTVRKFNPNIRILTWGFSQSSHWCERNLPWEAYGKIFFQMSRHPLYKWYLPFRILVDLLSFAYEYSLHEGFELKKAVADQWDAHVRFEVVALLYKEEQEEEDEEGSGTCQDDDGEEEDCKANYMPDVVFYPKFYRRSDGYDGKDDGKDDGDSGESDGEEDERREENEWEETTGFYNFNASLSCERILPGNGRAQNRNWAWPFVSLWECPVDVELLYKYEALWIHPNPKPPFLGLYTSQNKDDLARSLYPVIMKHADKEHTMGKRAYEEGERITDTLTFSAHKPAGLLIISSNAWGGTVEEFE
ncbi:hypothetical protein TWF481_008720 [Arthrobotrys musiformis]|uniref:F-box domain-containing protein n=1 Tax=Arthrobotrys musiformis TaxID=47236 RepID=A0AAV9W8Y0_9PEZI